MGLINYWTKEELAYVRENLQLSDAALAVQLGRTVKAVRNKRQQYRAAQRVLARNFTEEQRTTYIELWKRLTNNQLAAHYGITRRAINSINKSLNLRKERTVKPLKPKAHKERKTGRITLRRSSGKQSYWILTEEGWMGYHIYLWRTAGRDIPPKHCVTYIDRNPLNCTLENLEVVRKWDLILEAYPEHAKTVRENGRRHVAAPKVNDEERREQILTQKRINNKRYRDKIRQKRLEEGYVPKRRLIKTQADLELQAKREAKAAERRARKEAKEQLRKEREQRRQERRKGIVNMEKAWAAQGAQNRKREKRFVIREVNLSEKVAVRINAKTVVYVNKGADIERIIAKYKQAS